MTVESKILLVEDDASIATPLRELLEEAGYEVDWARDGNQGYAQALQQEYELLILDINLPGFSGLDICREVKFRQPSTPVVLLTARSEESDVVVGLEVGADDYVCKPFRPRELLARVRARLREQRLKQMAQYDENSGAVQNDEPEKIELGELRIDVAKRRIFKAEELLELTAKEFDLIVLLASKPGRPFHRDDLLSTVWGFDNPAYGPNVSVFVSRLRKKIEDDPLEPRYLLTVRGVGYRFAEPEDFSS